MITSSRIREITHFHLFCGLGGGAKGFNRGQARVGSLEAKFRCIGGVDVDEASIKDFGRLVGVAGTVLDLFSREQYVDFHGHEPPIGWREATPEDIRRAAGGERPNIVFLSAPCKGFSGLLSEKRSKTGKYQALNQLMMRGIWLMLEAWKNDPPELIISENVPRIANRGKPLVDQIAALLRSYVYTTVETTHDCGELGGLAQSRKRWLMVARHREKVPPFLYEPEKRTLKAVGDILGRMPVPGDLRGGPMHRIPSLHWKTWVRLAFVEAGGDWRSLSKLRVEDGKLQDYLLMPETRWEGAGRLGVTSWEEPSGTISGASRPENGRYSVADPRMEGLRHGPYGVCPWDFNARTISGESFPSNGNFSVADPRMNSDSEANRHKNVFRVISYSDAAGTISGGHGPSSGGQCVADPRHHGPAKHSNEFRVVPWGQNSCAITGAHGSGQCIADPRPQWENRYGNLHVADWQEPSKTVIAGGKGVQGGWLSVADPRPNCLSEDREAYLTGGHYGVVPWGSPSRAIPGFAKNNNGPWSVADPRLDSIPAQDEKLVAVIRALDGTWHRPFTTMELAALQSLMDPEETLELDGLSDSAWRERIGNAVPPEAAAAIAGVMGTTLLLAWSGETFMLSSMPIWVKPVAVALSVQQPEVEV